MEPKFCDTLASEFLSSPSVVAARLSGSLAEMHTEDVEASNENPVSQKQSDEQTCSLCFF